MKTGEQVVREMAERAAGLVCPRDFLGERITRIAAEFAPLGKLIDAARSYFSEFDAPVRDLTMIATRRKAMREVLAALDKGADDASNS